MHSLSSVFSDVRFDSPIFLCLLHCLSVVEMLYRAKKQFFFGRKISWNCALMLLPSLTPLQLFSMMLRGGQQVYLSMLSCLFCLLCRIARLFKLQTEPICFEVFFPRVSQKYLDKVTSHSGFCMSMYVLSALLAEC